MSVIYTVNAMLSTREKGGPKRKIKTVLRTKVDARNVERNAATRREENLEICIFVLWISAFCDGVRYLGSLGLVRFRS